MIKTYSVLLAALAFLAPGASRAGQIGEPAVPLEVSEWVKGNPVEVKAGTNIYIVEIFASWSLASRACITNLNALQERYRNQGVVVLAVSDEPAERLKQFMQGAGAQINYPVAADLNRRTSLGYMMPVREKGVPCAFIVGKDGRVLWHGHPAGVLEKALDEILAGTYDVKAARKLDAARMQMTQYLELAQRRDPRTKGAGRVVLAARTNDFALLCEMAFEIATAPRMPMRDAALANEALDQAARLSPTDTTRVDATRAVLLFETGKREEGLAQARAAVAQAKDPKEKANAEFCFRSMEARLKKAATKPEGSASTNTVKAPTP